MESDSPLGIHVNLKTAYGLSFSDSINITEQNLMVCSILVGSPKLQTQESVHTLLRKSQSPDTHETTW